MIVDSSAIVAIVRDESDADHFANALAGASIAAMSAVNWMEVAIIVDSANDPVASRRFDELVRVARIDIVAVTPDHAVKAREAYRDFGKGSGHRARLNFGDCFAYALATSTGRPLLFKGDDFTHTDLTSALR